MLDREYREKGHQDGMTTKSHIRALYTQLAPGTELHEGLSRILKGSTGALVVLGHDDVVEQISSGGFTINADFTPTRVRELAKMDGAIICDRQAHTILKAAVQLMPDSSIATNESGTRHRTAQRVSRQTGFPVISVSKSMRTIALYMHGKRHVLEGSERVLARGTQALATLEKYRSRLDQVTDSLSALEIEDMVTVRDIASVLQRQEMVRRISTEIEDDVLELGTDGRLLALQYEELASGLENNSALLIRDYVSEIKYPEDITLMLETLLKLNDADLIDLGRISYIIGLAEDNDSLDTPVHPYGYRILSGMKAVPGAIIERLVTHFNGLQNLMDASVEDLMAVEGVGDYRARSVHDGLHKISDSSLLERFI